MTISRPVLLSLKKRCLRKKWNNPASLAFEYPYLLRWSIDFVYAYHLGYHLVSWRRTRVLLQRRQPSIDLQFSLIFHKMQFWIGLICWGQNAWLPFPARRLDCRPFGVSGLAILFVWQETQALKRLEIEPTSLILWKAANVTPAQIIIAVSVIFI